MLVRYEDCYKPRTDGVKGRPTKVTLGEEYEVVSIPKYGFYRIINDSGKQGNYSQSRFTVISL